MDSMIIRGEDLIVLTAEACKCDFSDVSATRPVGMAKLHLQVLFYI